MLAGKLLGSAHGRRVEQVCIDSRCVSPNTLFVALKGKRADGHQFLGNAFRNGAVAAIVADTTIATMLVDPSWVLIAVPSPLRALQQLARWYRREEIGKVVAITGSNGKTVVKDALAAIFAGKKIMASPGSYNSQLGLPLAILSADHRVDLAFLEAGTSEPGEMEVLQDIASPDYGILTNIGMAHIASFGSREAIATEKMTLFRRIASSGWVLVPAMEHTIEAAVGQLQCRVYAVGSEKLGFSLVSRSHVDNGQIVELAAPSAGQFKIRIETRSPEIILDIQVAASAAYLLGIKLEDIALSLEGYAPPPTRMEVWSSQEHIAIVNDAYSSDPVSVHAALRATGLGASKAGRKIFAFGGMREMGRYTESEHYQVGVAAAEYGFSHLVLVGNGNLQHTLRGYKETHSKGSAKSVNNSKELKEYLLKLLRPGDTVLFKGPREGEMGRAGRELTGSIAQRCLWVQMSAIAGNLACFQRHCGGKVKIMAMLKALAYGTDLVQLAFWMSQLGIHQIGVSSTSEGMSIRKLGVNQEIYVFLPDRDDADNLLRYHLTPVLYSSDLVDAFATTIHGSKTTLPVHLMVNTGMNHLGVEPGEALDVARRIKATGTLRFSGICTHFASADDPGQDDFTRGQIATFNETLRAIRGAGFEDFLVHAANTAATIRFPEAHYDMVRIGIGLYGTYTSDAVREALPLELAVGVTSRIAAIREVRQGEGVGYQKSYVAPKDIRVGIVPFGYDDGLPWRLSGTAYHALVDGQEAPLIGRICMDQMQIDITHLSGVDVGAEVLLYGSHGGYKLRPEDVAKKADTISHELLVRLGKRVERIYIAP